jgi:hypothetical protein
MEFTQPTSAFQALLQQARLEDLEQELRVLQMQFRSKVDAYQQALAELEQLDDQLQKQTKLLNVLREIQPAADRDADDASDDDSDDEASGGATMTKREIAERILRDSPKPLFPREVRDVAVAEGWLPDTPAAANQLAVAMNRAATKQDHLIKDNEGRYSLPRMMVGVGSSLFPDEDERGEGS